MPNLPIWNDYPEGRAHIMVEVAPVLAGKLELPLHVITGRKAGPTLGLMATVHGDETLPPIIIRELLHNIDPAQLSGRVAAVPVCNPLAMAAFARQTPEQHGKTDLHEVFPGNARGNITARLASTIATQLIDHVDVLIDYHCGGAGGRLQSRADVHSEAPEDVRERSVALARCFGTRMVAQHNLGGTAVAYANAQGKVAFNAETGGVYLPREVTDGYIGHGVQGYLNVMKDLGMLPGEMSERPEQVLYALDRRKEVNPSRAGYLRSNFQTPDDL